MPPTATTTSSRRGESGRRDVTRAKTAATTIATRLTIAASTANANNRVTSPAYPGAAAPSSAPGTGRAPACPRPVPTAWRCASPATGLPQRGPRVASQDASCAVLEALVGRARAVPHHGGELIDE